MTLDNQIYIGMFGMFLQDGIFIENLDEVQNIVYISLPEDSYAYHIGDSATPEELAKNIKEKLFKEILGVNVRLKMKIRKKEYWTKEMGEKNYQENIGRVLNLFKL